MTKRYEGKKLRPGVLRGIVIGLFMLAILAGIVFHTAWGSISAFGIGNIYLLCPLGGLEAMLGSRSFILHALIAIIVVGILTLLVGKAFCSWGCPTAYISRFLGGKKGREAAKEEQLSCAKQALAAFRASRCSCAEGTCASGSCAVSVENSSDSSTEPTSAKPRKNKIDSRHFVLGGALVTALVFGFPVFCLICPIGLTVATVVAWVQLIGFNQPSLGLILFPAIIVVELLVLRKWCHTLCPISALLSLIASHNRTLRPKVDEGKCLRYTKDEGCSVCSSVCPELIDPHSDLGIRPIAECTRCGKCAEACPQGAIGFIRNPR